MTVGRSEQANTLVVDMERKGRNTVGCVPRVTFFLLLRYPGSHNSIDQSCIRVKLRKRGTVICVPKITFLKLLK